MNTEKTNLDIDEYQHQVEAELGYDNKKVDLNGYEDDEEADFKWN